MKTVALVPLLLGAVVLSGRADTSVVFNEIMYHPVTNEAAMEWVELYNQMAVDVDMSGWTLDGEIQYRFATNTILHGGEFMVLAASPTNLAAATGLTNILGPFTGRLGNGARQVLLRNNNGRVVNEVDYDVSGDWPVAANGAGPSLAKLDHSTAGDRDHYWAASAQMGGTPGRENFPSSPVVVPLVLNETSATTNADFWLELMNYGTNTLPIGSYTIVCDAATNSQYTITPGVTLSGGGFLTLNSAVLGFHPVPGNRLYLLPPTQTNVLDACLLPAGPQARWPDGPGAWRAPALPTPGTSNVFVFHNEIVINEIMYHHQMLPATNVLVQGRDSGEAWVELYNRSTNTVDLTGWKLAGGIHYSFPAGKTVLPNAYLVVANDKTNLQASYPAIDIVGNYSGNLSHQGDSIVLLDAAGNPVNKVRYYPGGRWAEAADAGGSSLELRDPFADNAQPGAWAASDESAKTSWQTYTYQAVAQTIVGTNQWNDFILGLLADGECLVDDIGVVESPGTAPVQFIANGSFENGATGWRFLGNHMQSRVEPEPGNPANHVLHIVAGGVQGDQQDHIETTYINGHSVTDGHTYQISFRARWLSGNNLLNTRLYYNRVARTTVLPVPALNGTPGMRNSRYAGNIGPTFSQFRHAPTVPAVGQPVTVSVAAQDPQGVSNCEVWWSANGGAFAHASMTPQTNGLYAGTIPGFAAETIVQFYVRGVDGLGAPATYPAAGANSGALYMVDDGQADFSQGHNLRVVLSPSSWALLRAPTNLLGSAFLPCTLIYDEQRPYYDMQVRLKGSPLGRVRDPYPSFHMLFQPDDLFRGVHSTMLIDTSGRASGANPLEQIVVNHMNLHAGGIPEIQPDLCRVIPPYATNTCPAVLLPRFEDEFIATASPKGDDGTVFSMEIVYYPTTANAAGYKLPSPQALWTDIDIKDLGDDKETYRYDFMIKNHRNQDDYSGLIAFAKTLWLPNTPTLFAQSRQVMDMDEWLRTFAMISLVGEGDWYSFSYPHNLGIYFRPDNHHAVALPYDVEQLFMQSPTASLIGSAVNDWTDLESQFPANTRRLYAHALDLINSTFNTNYMAYWTAHYGGICGEDFSDLLDWIPQRTAGVLDEVAGAGGNSAFSISGTNFIVTSSNLVTLSGTAPVQVQTLLINGIAYPVTWTSVSEWTVSIPVSAATNVLLLTAMDLNGNRLTNYGGTVTVNYTGVPANAVGSVVINEIMFNPLVPDASYVELLNASDTTTFDLSNWSVGGLGYTFPPGTILGAGEFLVLAKNPSAFVTAYGPTTVPFGQFPGNLSTDGETLTLRMPGSQTNEIIVVDKVRYSTNAPWPACAPGMSVQLIDPSQQTSRVGNWAVAGGTPATNNSVAATLPMFPPLWINELQAVNLTGITNSAGQHAPWLELYNPGTNTVFLTNLFLANKYTNLTAWAFPSSAVISPGQFKIIFADGRTDLSTTNEPHTSFTLTGGSGSVALSRRYNGQPQVLDYMDYTNLPPDRSYGSFPDGQPFDRRPFFYPTPGGTNNGSTGGSFIAYTESGLVYTQDFNSLPNPGPTSVNSANPVTINGVTYSLPNPFDFAFPPVASGYSGGLGLPLLEGWYGLADPASTVGTRFGASYGDQTTGGQISFGPASSANRALGLLATSTTGFTAFGARFENQTANMFNRINLQVTGEVWRQSDKAKALQFYYLVDPTGAQPFTTNATAFLPALDVRFPTIPSAVGGVAVDGTLPANQTNLAVFSQVISNWPPGAALWLVWKMADPAGKAQGLGIDNLSFSAWTEIPNTAPVLGPVSNKFVYAGQTLQFTASGSDTDQPPQTLTFSLDPGAPMGATISSSGSFSWTAASVPVPSTNSFTIRVTDNGTPPLSATCSFTVAVLPPPQFSAMRPVGVTLPLRFNSLVGQTYQVEYKDSLSSPFWLPVGSPVPGNGAIMEVDDDMTGQTQRFYRLLVLP